MEPMNRFLSGNRQGVKDFIDAICNIPAERTTFALPASYSTPITILARLPPTSREGFPSLPYLIDHARNFAALVKLWTDATTHYLPSEGLDGDLSEFNDLCINLRRRADEYLSQAEQGGQTADQLSLQWDDLVERLESSTLHSAAADPTLSPSIEPEMHHPPWTDISTSFGGGHRAPPGSAGSEAANRERHEQQSFWDTTFGKDGKPQRPFGSSDEASGALQPSRGHSSNGKQPTRSFLGGLRRKGKGDGPGDRDTGTGLGTSWNSSMS